MHTPSRPCCPSTHLLHLLFQLRQLALQLCFHVSSHPLGSLTSSSNGFSLQATREAAGQRSPQGAKDGMALCTPLVHAAVSHTHGMQHCLPLCDIALPLQGPATGCLELVRARARYLASARAPELLAKRRGAPQQGFQLCSLQSPRECGAALHMIQTRKVMCSRLPTCL